MSNKQLFESILNEFCFPCADRNNEEQFEMTETSEKRDVPVLPPSIAQDEFVKFYAKE